LSYGCMFFQLGQASPRFRMILAVECALLSV